MKKKTNIQLSKQILQMWKENIHHKITIPQATEDRRQQDTPTSKLMGSHIEL